jgi:hypothetical protein
MIVVAFAAALVAGAVALAVWSRRLRVRGRVMVALKSGNAIGGVIVRSLGSYVVLADPEIFDAESGQSTPADGEIWLERSNVDYVQAISGRR